MEVKPLQLKFVVCIRNEGYPASLELRKIYAVLPGPLACRGRMLRIVDESGEDYLYPKSYFLPIHLPVAIRRTLLHTG
jgi:hypothetical protein